MDIWEEEMDIWEACKKGDLFLIENLLTTDPSLLESRNHSSNTPLNNTCCHVRKLKVANYLINKGAKVNVRNLYGHTPLHYISCHRHPKGIQFLINKGADINIKNNNDQSPLCYASSFPNNLGSIKFLVSKGSKIIIQYKPIDGHYSKDANEYLIFVLEKRKSKISFPPLILLDLFVY